MSKKEFLTWPQAAKKAGINVSTLINRCRALGFKPKAITSKPVSLWTEKDIETYLKEEKKHGPWIKGGRRKNAGRKKTKPSIKEQQQ